MALHLHSLALTHKTPTNQIFILKTWCHLRSKNCECEQQWCPSVTYPEVLDWLGRETSAWTALLNTASYLCHLVSTEHTIKYNKMHQKDKSVNSKLLARITQLCICRLFQAFVQDTGTRSISFNLCNLRISFRRSSVIWLDRKLPALPGSHQS